MNDETLIPPLVLIRVPRQKCDELYNLTINGMRPLVVGEPKRGMNYARLVRIESIGKRFGLALLLTQEIDRFTNKDPLIISYKDIGNVEAALRILGHKLEDLPRAWI